MDVFVLLPATGWRVYAVAEIVLEMHSLTRLKWDGGGLGQTYLSVLVRRYIGPLELGLPSTSSAADWLEHGLEREGSCLRVLFSGADNLE